jgi:hypothetical protein
MLVSDDAMALAVLSCCRCTLILMFGKLAIEGCTTVVAHVSTRLNV